LPGLKKIGAQNKKRTGKPEEGKFALASSKEKGTAQ